MTTNVPNLPPLDRLLMLFTQRLVNEYQNKFMNYKDFTMDYFTYQYNYRTSNKSGHIDVFSLDFSKNNVKTTKYYRAWLAVLDELGVPYQEKKAGAKPGRENQANYHSLEVSKDLLEEAIESKGVDNIVNLLNEKVQAIQDVDVMPVLKGAQPRVPDQNPLPKGSKPQQAPPPPPREEPQNAMPPPLPPRTAQQPPAPPPRAAAKATIKPAAAQSANFKQKEAVFLRTEKTYMTQKLDLELRIEALNTALEEAETEAQKKTLQIQQKRLQDQLTIIVTRMQKLEADANAFLPPEDLALRKKTLFDQVAAQAEKKLTAAAKPVIAQAYRLEKQTEGKKMNAAQLKLDAKLELQEKQLRAQAALLGEEAKEKIKALEESIQEQVEKAQAKTKPGKKP